MGRSIRSSQNFEWPQRHLVRGYHLLSPCRWPPTEPSHELSRKHGQRMPDYVSFQVYLPGSFLTFLKMRWPSLWYRWCNRRQRNDGRCMKMQSLFPSKLWAEETQNTLTIHNQRDHVALFLHWNGVGEDNRVVSCISFTHFHDGEFIANYHCVIGFNGPSISVPKGDNPKR